MRSRLTSLSVLLLGLLWATHTHDPEPSSTQPRLLPRPCAAESPAGYRLRCHWLPLGQGQALAAARLEPAAGAARAPLLYLAGGPGQGGNTSADSLATWAAWGRRAAPDRALILVDLRHAPGARGTRDCPAYGEASRELLARPLSPQAESNELAPVLRACLDALAANIPFSSYATPRYAADLRALQFAYGDDSWTLLGVSYGTRLAWVAAGELALEGMILDSPYPPGRGGATEAAARLRHAFAVWWRDCDAGRGCPDEVTDAQATFWRAVNRLDAAPQQLRVADWDRGGRAPVAVNGARLIVAAYGALYSEVSRVDVWPLVRAAAEGLTLPQALFERLYNVSFDPAFNAMTFWLTECSDNPPAQWLPHAQLGPWAAFFQGEVEFDVCAAAGLGQTPLAAAGPPTVPVLAAVGSRDPVTPPAYARDLAASAAARLLVGVGAGHAEYVFSDCGIAQIRQWLRGEKVADCGIWRTEKSSQKFPS